MIIVIVIERWNFSDADDNIDVRRVESDQTDGTSLTLNAGYLDRQEKTDRLMQRAMTEESSDTGKIITVIIIVAEKRGLSASIK